MIMKINDRYLEEEKLRILIFNLIDAHHEDMTKEELKLWDDLFSAAHPLAQYYEKMTDKKFWRH